MPRQHAHCFTFQVVLLCSSPMLTHIPAARGVPPPGPGPVAFPAHAIPAKPATSKPLQLLLKILPHLLALMRNPRPTIPRYRMIHGARLYTVPDCIGEMVSPPGPREPDYPGTYVRMSDVVWVDIRIWPGTIQCQCLGPG